MIRVFVWDPGPRSFRARFLLFACLLSLPRVGLAEAPLFDAGVALYQQGRYRAACEELTRSRDRQEAAPKRELYYGMCEERLGRWQAAERSLAEYLREHPDDGDASYWMGNAQLFLREFAESKASFEKVLMSKPGDGDAYRGLGTADLELKDYQGAYQAWWKAVQQNGKDEKSKYLLGRLFYEADLPNEAAGWLRDALQLNPADYEATTYLGLCAEALGMNDVALKLYRRGVALSEQQGKPYARAFWSLGSSLNKNGEEAEALSVLQRGAEECPDAEELTALGGLLLKEKQTKRAEELLRKAIALDDELPEAHYRLALLLNASRRASEGEAEMAKFQEMKTRAAKEAKVLAIRK